MFGSLKASAPATGCSDALFELPPQPLRSCHANSPPIDVAVQRGGTTLRYQALKATKRIDLDHDGLHSIGLTANGTLFQVMPSPEGGRPVARILSGQLNVTDFLFTETGHLLASDRNGRILLFDHDRWRNSAPGLAAPLVGAALSGLGVSVGGQAFDGFEPTGVQQRDSSIVRWARTLAAVKMPNFSGPKLAELRLSTAAGKRKARAEAFLELRAPRWQSLLEVWGTLSHDSEWPKVPAERWLSFELA